MSVTFTLGLALIPYALVLLFVIGYGIFAVYHLVHYGATTGLSFTITFAYLAGTIFILFFTWQALNGVDWRQPITFSPPTSLSMPAAPLP